MEYMDDCNWDEYEHDYKQYKGIRETENGYSKFDLVYVLLAKISFAQEQKYQAKKEYTVAKKIFSHDQSDPRVFPKKTRINDWIEHLKELESELNSFSKNVIDDAKYARAFKEVTCKSNYLDGLVDQELELYYTAESPGPKIIKERRSACVLCGIKCKKGVCPHLTYCETCTQKIRGMWHMGHCDICLRKLLSFHPCFDNSQL